MLSLFLFKFIYRILVIFKPGKSICKGIRLYNGSTVNKCSSLLYHITYTDKIQENTDDHNNNLFPCGIFLYFHRTGKNTGFQ